MNGPSISRICRGLSVSCGVCGGVCVVWCITFLPRSKHLLISWLQSPSAVILEPPKIKSATVSTVSPTISHKVMEPDAIHDVRFLNVEL